MSDDITAKLRVSRYRFPNLCAAGPDIVKLRVNRRMSLGFQTALGAISRCKSGPGKALAGQRYARRTEQANLEKRPSGPT